MKYVLELPKPEQTHVVSLEKQRAGVSLKVGNYYILTIKDDGSIVRPSSISPETGLILDEHGRVKID